MLTQLHLHSDNEVVISAKETILDKPQTKDRNDGVGSKNENNFDRLRWNYFEDG